MADVTLPQLGETVTEGTITQWFKNVGDTVAADEPLFEVSTDKVDTEVPSPVSGVLTEIRVQEGDTVDVGTVIAVVGDADGAAPAAPAPEAAPAPAPEVASLPAANRSSRHRRLRPRRRRHLRLLLRRRRPRSRASRTAGAVAGNRCSRRQPAAVARGASTRQRQRPRPRCDHRHRPRRSDHPRRRARPSRCRRRPTGRPRPARRPALQLPPRCGSGSAPPLQPAPAPAPAAAPAPTCPAPAAAPATAGGRDTTLALSKIRRLTGDHMVMSKATSPHAFSVVEVDFANVDVVRNKVKNEWKADARLRTHVPAVHRPRRHRRPGRVPAPQRERERHRPRRAQLHRPRHRRRPRLRGSAGPRHP